MSHTFKVPQHSEVSEANQNLFDAIQKGVGFVPNLYATFAYSENALGTYLQFQNAKTSISKKEREVINLVVSQINECRYCQSAHTTLGKMNGFTDEQIIEIRQGSAQFNPKLDALVKITKEITLNKGKISESVLSNFFAAGYTKGSLVDVILNIADKVIMNYLHNITNVPIDFPIAPELTAPVFSHN